MAVLPPCLVTCDSSHEGGKLRIAALYAQHPSPKEAQEFLKDEYGIGGHSHTWLDGSINSSREHRDFMEFYIGADSVCYDVRSNNKRADGRVFSLYNTLWMVAVASPLILFLFSR